MSLPKGYKRLEYIQSSGTQYIDTGFAPNHDTRVIADFQFLAATTAFQSVFGSRTSASSANRFCFYLSSSSYFRSDYGNTNQSFPNTISTTGRHTVDKNKNVTLIDGTNSVTHTATSFTSALNLTLFANNTNGKTGEFGSEMLYSCQIYDNGTLVRDFVPCQNASGAVGLWDAANEVFYGNAGTGTFAAGPVVPEIVDESEITELEYIQSSGTQYMDTGVVGKTGVKTFLDFTIVSGNLSDFIAVGCAPASYSPRFYPVTTQSGKWAYGYSGWVNSSTTATTGQRYAIATELVSGSQRMTVGSSSVASSTSTTSVNVGLNMFLFGANIGGTYKSYGSIRVYAFQIYVNGLLERDYIPAKLSNGEAGLYDRVFHAFYRNAGTGEFIAGPEAQTVPKAPENFRVDAKDGTLLTLAWDASKKATGYRLYRSGQLLADTEETSISVAVEPFAGAVFTLTAYNENGEGAGAELTYFNAPDDPILFLVTDRTQRDVAERNTKGYYAASDLNRVGFAVKYLAGRLKDSGVSVTVSPVLTWTDEEWATPSAMTAYLKDVQTMRNALKVAEATPTAPEDMAKLTYSEANDIEAILVALDVHITRMLSIVDAGWASGLAYTGFYAKEAY